MLSLSLVAEVINDLEKKGVRKYIQAAKKEVLLELKSKLK